MAVRTAEEFDASAFHWRMGADKVGESRDFEFVLTFRATISESSGMPTDQQKQTTDYQQKPDDRTSWLDRSQKKSSGRNYPNE